MPTLALSEKTGYYSTTHHRLGRKNLWSTQGLQLPAYIQNIARSIRKQGHSTSHSIALAVAAVKRWARGGGNVSAEVRAAAAKAVAEWDAARAKARATPNKRRGSRVSTSNPRAARSLSLARKVASQAGARRYGAPVGTPLGGDGNPQEGKQAARGAGKAPAGNAQHLVGASSADLRKALAGKDDAQLVAAAKAVLAADQSNPHIKQLRKALAFELRQRRIDIDDLPDKATGKGNTTMQHTTTRPTRLANTTAVTTAVTSQDGPKVTKQASTKPAGQQSGKKKLSPAQIKLLVGRLNQVAPAKQDAYKTKVIALARANGALDVIPKEWLTGRSSSTAGKKGNSGVALANAIQAGVSAALAASGVELDYPVTIRLAAGSGVPANFTPSGQPTAHKRSRAQKAGHTFKDRGTSPIENLFDLGKAIDAYGRIADAERPAYKRYLLSEARRLRAPRQTIDRINNLGKAAQKKQVGGGKPTPSRGASSGGRRVPAMAGGGSA